MSWSMVKDDTDWLHSTECHDFLGWKMRLEQIWKAAGILRRTQFVPDQQHLQVPDYLLVPLGNFITITEVWQMIYSGSWIASCASLFGFCTECSKQIYIYQVFSHFHHFFKKCHSLCKPVGPARVSPESLGLPGNTWTCRSWKEWQNGGVGNLLTEVLTDLTDDLLKRSEIYRETEEKVHIS